MSKTYSVEALEVVMVPRKAALKRAGISATTAWRLEKEGKFPARRQLSPGKVGYLSTELDDWIAGRPTAAGTARKGATTPSTPA